MVEFVVELIVAYVIVLAIIGFRMLYLNKAGFSAEAARKAEEDSKIFKITFDEFMAMNEQGQDEIFNKAFEINWPNAQEVFEQHKEIDWVVMGQSPSKIISSGNRENEPYEEDLMKLAKEIDAVPFCYSRPPIIE